MSEILSQGPFYHGTMVALEIGDQLKAGFPSNYQEDLVMNHIYFTELLSGAAHAAAYVSEDGRGHVYRVEPTGEFEDDPNVTDKKYPGNPTRSFRSQAPLTILEEIKGYDIPTKEEIQKRVEGLAQLKMTGKAEIIN
ncbi:MAG: NAD(+)--rifampin ADP-ribosyltransferase [Streptococcaceae bacterium]|nr:NAD(+)--rifampin ADP-ribosyltransferase [Streptococcaceae bacterium]